MLKIILIWLANVALKIFLFIVLIGLAMMVLANDGQKMSAPFHVVVLEEKVGKTSYLE